MSDPIVGIDLGTSNTVVARADAMGNVRVLADDSGYKIHPSVVSFHPNGGVVVGAPAKQRKVIDPQNTIYSVKRLIGRAFSSPEVQTAKQRMPYQIKEGGNQLPLIVTRAGEFAVPEVSAIVLDHVKALATTQLGAPVGRAVVTVPASFNDAQRAATATAGAIAGLTVVRVLNEPTAAALAYGHARNLKQTIAVYDFGGGTFDITILKLHDQVYEVLGTAGDTFLGGDDLDERIVDKMVAKFLAEHRIDLRTNEVSMMRLRAVAEQTKIELSRRSRAVVRVDEIAYGPKGKPLNLSIEISRDEFVAQVADIIDKTFPVCTEALSYAGLGITGIDDVILVGGTTKIPYVRDQVARYFGKSPRTDVNPEDAVAVGAALQAVSLERILGKATGPVPVQRPSQPTITAPVAPGASTIVDIPDLPTHAGITDLDAALRSDAPRATVAKPSSTYNKQPISQPDVRVETEYSLPHTGTKDIFEIATPPAGTPIPNAAIGRLRAPSRSDVNRTVVGPPPVSPPPASAAAPNPPPRPSRLATAPSPPPPQIPPSPEVDADWGSHDDFQTNPGLGTELGAATEVSPPPPTAPTTRPLPAQRAPSQPRPGRASAPPPLPPTTTGRHKTPSVPPPVPTAPATARTMLELEHASVGPASRGSEPARTTARGTAVDRSSVGAAERAHAERPPSPHAALVEPSPGSTVRGMAPPAAHVAPLPLSASPIAAAIVMDVTPRSLGIATVAGYCEELIRRNSRVPAEKIKKFTTSRDRQDAVRIVVCQGESRRIADNVVIGDLRLDGLPPRPRGETSIEVTFSLDASGILQVTARDALTGNQQQASLDLVGGLGEQQVAASRERLQAMRR